MNKHIKNITLKVLICQESEMLERETKPVNSAVDCRVKLEKWLIFSPKHVKFPCPI
jgi:hypothetical protein